MYDVIIAGGRTGRVGTVDNWPRQAIGSLFLKRSGIRYHKVCGEYIKFESWNFLQELGLPLSDWNLPVIRTLLLSAPNGLSLEQELPLGGFGISRYKIDAALAALARTAGVDLFEGVRVTDMADLETGLHCYDQRGQIRGQSGLWHVWQAQ